MKFQYVLVNFMAYSFKYGDEISHCDGNDSFVILLGRLKHFVGHQDLGNE